jgi:hypothetical protein
MAGLTKMVRHRLGRAPGGIDHPDANLLAGFIEHSLTSRERSLVLGHLAQCAECREQVSVALPKMEAATTPAVRTAAGGWPVWLRWPVLRWGLLVASLAIMGTVALVRQPPTRRMELASRANVAPRSAAPLPSDATIGAAPSKAAKPAGHLSQETAGELAVNLAQTRRREKGEHAAEVQFAMRALEAAATSKAQTPARVPAEAFHTGPSATPSGGSNQPSTAIVAQALPPPPPAAPRAAQPARQASDLLASPQAKSAEGLRAPEEEKGKSAGAAVGGAVGGLAQVAPAATPSHQFVGSLVAAPKARDARLVKSDSGPAPGASSTGLSAEASKLIAADWSISASGRVQRSQDGRKTWEELDVDKNVVFRVVFAVGPDVWLGGTKGALYHSTDGGQHWTRVSITTRSITVTDAVVHIQFKDAQHGTITTVGGDTWTTLDGGQRWEKQ